MNQVSIVTAQNVTLTIELANIGDRFLAAIVDVLIKIGVLLAVSFLTFLLRDAGGSTVSKVLWVIAVIFLVFYSLLFEYFMKGQTPGKRSMQIRVARLDGEQVTFGNLLLRWLFRIIDFPLTWPAIGISVITFTKKFQRIGDLIAGTILVTTKERTTLEDTTYSEIERNYEPQFAEVSHLRGKDAEVIKKVLRFYGDYDNYELVQLTAQKLRAVLDLHTNMDDLTFLRTVLKDYNSAGAYAPKSDYQPFSY